MKHLLDAPGRGLSRAYRSIPAQVRFAFFSTLILGLVVHLFAFTNYHFNHDGLKTIYQDMVTGGIHQGKWFQSFAAAPSGNFPMPWVIGMISLVYAGLATSYFVAAFEIRSKLYAALLGFLLVSFPSAGTAYAYMYMADVWFLSILLMSIGVYLAKRYRYGFLAGSIAIAFSMGSYQAYIDFGATAFLILIIQDIVSGQDTPKQIFIRGLKYVAALALGGVLYYAILNLLVAKDSVALWDYKGLDEIGKLSLADIPGRVLTAYQSFFDFYSNYLYGAAGFLIFTNISAVIFFVIFALCILHIAYLFKTRAGGGRPWAPLLLLLAMLVLFPLASNAIYLMVADKKFVYLLMMYPLVMSLLLPLVMLSQTEQRVLRLSAAEGPGLPALCRNEKVSKVLHICLKASLWVQLALLMLVGFNNYIVLNESYMKAHISKEQAQFYSLQFYQHVTDFEEYEEGMPIMRIGYHGYVDTVPELNANKIYGAPNKSLIINANGYGNYFLNMFGVDLNIQRGAASQEWIDEHFDEVKAMSVYPAEGCMKVIDGTLYIKLKNVNKT